MWKPVEERVGLHRKVGGPEWIYFKRPEKPPADSILQEGPEGAPFIKVIKH